jgi:hypothetical protein
MLDNSISLLLKSISFSLFLVVSANGQNKTDYLTNQEIKNDLGYLDQILQDISSYQGLNGYDYKRDFEAYLNHIEKQDQISKYNFGLFLSQTIGKIGDRHAYIDGYESRDEFFIPMAFAPYQGRILVLNFDKQKKRYAFHHAEYPYLKSINGTPVERILSKALPNDILAPKSSYFTRAIRELRDIDKVFAILKKELPNPLPITLSNDSGKSKEIYLDLVPRSERPKIWDERFHMDNFFLTDEEANNPEIINQFFSLKDQIAYIRLVTMVDKEDSPGFISYFNEFMAKAKSSQAMIVDVRDNGGGTRDMIQELAGYFIHPDSVYVVNATKQRGRLPLSEELKSELNTRYLFSKQHLNEEEQKAVDKFSRTFHPMYQLDRNKYSEYYYYLFNGSKLAVGKYHYNKPIYILCNERSFSAASVLVSVFKGLPNVQIVGTNTDGSSGNSERFELPHSELRGKISTMVSFQKNGNILDGIGTSPDILIERNLDQIFMKEDYQLRKLKELIQSGDEMRGKRIPLL